MEQKALAKLTDRQKAEISTHLRSFRADLATAEIDRAFALVERGFDPMFHLMVYQARITVTIDGFYFWAQGDPSFDRVLSKPITSPEEREAYGVGTNEIGVLAYVYRKGQPDPVCSGFGRASKDEKAPVIRGSFVEHEHPYRMAEKRAEAQALRKFRAIGIPALIAEELAIVEQPEDVPMPKTIEGEVTYPETAARSLKIENVGQLLEAARRLYQMDRAAVFAELNVLEAREIDEPFLAWMKIVAARE